MVMNSIVTNNLKLNYRIDIFCLFQRSNIFPIFFISTSEPVQILKNLRMKYVRTKKCAPNTRNIHRWRHVGHIHVGNDTFLSFIVHPRGTKCVYIVDRKYCDIEFALIFPYNLIVQNCLMYQKTKDHSKQFFFIYFVITSCKLYNLLVWLVWQLFPASLSVPFTDIIRFLWLLRFLIKRSRIAENS